MARGINKVILIGNLGRDPETPVYAGPASGDELQRGDERVLAGPQHQRTA